jgi:hypothetical protein
MALNALIALNEETPLSKLILVMAGPTIDRASAAQVDGRLRRLSVSLVKPAAMARICS